MLDSLALKHKLEIPAPRHLRKPKAEPTDEQGVPAPGPMSPLCRGGSGFAMEAGRAEFRHFRCAPL